MRADKGTVVVSHLQHWVRLQQAVFDGLHMLTGWTGDSIVLQDLLGRLSLASSALPRDQDALVLPLRPHGSVRVVCHCIAGGKVQTSLCIHIKSLCSSLC